MSQVYEPVQVGVMGGGRCGLGICNPSLTHTHDTGSQVLPASMVDHGWFQNPQQSAPTTHKQQSPTMTQNGSVCKKTEIELDATKGNWTIGCGCLILEFIQFTVEPLQKYSKTVQRPVFKLYIICTPYTIKATTT